MPQSKSKSQARFQVAGSPVPVVRADADHPRRPDFEEYDPNAPVGAEEPSSNPGTYEVEDEREEQENERINSNTKISRESVDNLKDTIGGGVTINERMRKTNQGQKPYQQEKELDEAFD